MIRISQLCRWLAAVAVATLGCSEVAIVLNTDDAGIGTPGLPNQGDGDSDADDKHGSDSGADGAAGPEGDDGMGTAGLDSGADGAAGPEGDDGMGTAGLDSGAGGSAAGSGGDGVGAAGAGGTPHTGGNGGAGAAGTAGSGGTSGAGGNSGCTWDNEEDDAAEPDSCWQTYASRLEVRQDVVGDFNGDGHQDVVRYSIAPIDERDHMAATEFRLWLGNPSEGPHEVMVNHTGAGLRGLLLKSPEEPLTGRTLAVGNFDGDGFDDLVIGNPLHDAPAYPMSGAIYVLYGHKIREALRNHSGAVPLEVETEVLYQGVEKNGETLFNAREPWDRFGDVLETGDYNCDGVDDLAVGVPYESQESMANVGAVHVIPGRSREAPSSGIGGFDLKDDLWRTQDAKSVKGVAESNDRFGWSLAASRLSGEANGNTPCDSLLVGVPFEDIGSTASGVNAGAVQVFYSSPGDPISTADDELWDLQSTGVPGKQRRNTMFGTRLRAFPQSVWIETSITCEAKDNFKSVNLISENQSGDGRRLTSNGASERCWTHRPGSLENERGRYIEKRTAHVDYLQYIPPAFDPSRGDAKILVIVQGSAGAPESDRVDIWRKARQAAGTWPAIGAIGRELAETAELENMIVVLPYADHRFEGFHQLLGRDQNFDVMLNELVRAYDADFAMGTGEKFYLFGHSAGGTAVARYMARHPNRIIGGVMSASGDFTWPYLDRPPVTCETDLGHPICVYDYYHGDGVERARHFPLYFKHHVFRNTNWYSDNSSGTLRDFNVANHSPLGVSSSTYSDFAHHDNIHVLVGMDDATPIYKKTNPLEDPEFRCDLVRYTHGFVKTVHERYPGSSIDLCVLDDHHHSNHQLLLNALNLMNLGNLDTLGANNVKACLTGVDTGTWHDRKPPPGKATCQDI